MCFTGPHAEFYEVLTLECRPSRRRRVEFFDATRVRGYGLSLNLGGGPDNEIKIQFILDMQLVLPRTRPYGKCYLLPQNTATPISGQ
jgi:hypothetical protein